MSDSQFLRDYMLLGEGTEIPPQFGVWCGLAGVSAILGRRVWLDMGTYTVFPNLYVVLVAGSGRCRKSTAIGVMEKAIRMLEPGPNIIAQRITPEGLIDAMKLQEFVTDGSGIAERCEGFVIVDELSTFLNKQTYESGLASLLIPLFDCKDKFEYRTKSRGAETVSNSCLGLLGASTVDWIRNAIPVDAIGGGLTSRIIFVYVETPPPPVAITVFGSDKRDAFERVVKGLERMQMLEGKVSLTPESWKFYQEEYDRFYCTNRMFEDPMLSGYASRRHVHMLKLGMILAIASTERLVVEYRHLEGARDFLVQAEHEMPRVLGLISQTEKGNVNQVVLQIIKQSKEISRSEVLAKMSNRIDVRELGLVIETLVHSHKVKVVAKNLGVGGNTEYFFIAL